VTTQDVVDERLAPRAAAPGAAPPAAAPGAAPPPAAGGKPGPSASPEAKGVGPTGSSGGAAAKSGGGSSASAAPGDAAPAPGKLPPASASEEPPPGSASDEPPPASSSEDSAQQAAADKRELSGPKWVDRFPTSRSLDDLEADFQKKAKAFVGALQAAGATVEINATFRPKERAFLMHWCYHVANKLVSPKKVPKMAGVDIDWDHGDDRKSRTAAQEMVDAYDIAHEPALASRHTERKAVDMDISWTGTLKIKKADATEVSIGAPENGADNKMLHAVGKSYGVIKLQKDPPHWSSDGH
jgi:hypothetical protein